MNTIQEFRRKRFDLTSGISDHHRLPSAERRKQIQNSLEDFKKNIKPNKISPKPNQTHQPFYSHQQQLKRTPTMKDIFPANIESSVKQIKVENAEENLNIPQETVQKKREIQEQNLIKEEDQLQQNFQEVQQEIASESTEQKIDGIKVQQQSQIKEEIKESEEEKYDISIEESKTPEKFKLQEPTYKLEESEKLKQNYNESHYGSSSENSSAIFFTSQFKQYINRQKQLDKFQTIQEKEAQTIKYEEEAPKYQEKELGQSDLKIIDESASETQKNKQKTESIALSNNESSLKYSFVNESGVQDIINKKLDEELVIQINDFSKGKLQEFLEKAFVHQKDKLLNDFKEFRKRLNFQRKVQLDLKRYCFDGFLILMDYKFEEVKNELKIDNFIKEKKKQKMKECFEGLKENAKYYSGLDDYYRLKTQQKMKTNIFKVFKMLWYDAKVVRQIDLYYASKIFSSWKNVIAKQKRKQQNAALKLYAKNLKKTYFYYLVQGIQNLRRERQNAQMAEYFYVTNLMRKVMDAWKQKTHQEPKFISLTMTSKNTFYETKNNKWLQSKTVDFRQLK